MNIHDIFQSCYSTGVHRGRVGLQSCDSLFLMNIHDIFQSCYSTGVRRGTVGLQSCDSLFLMNIHDIFQSCFSTRVRLGTVGPGFYTKLNFWGSLGLSFEYDGGPILKLGVPSF